MHNTIEIKGAREHNLKNVNTSIPKNKFVVFTGVSGSGKSSLAFDTLYAEGQRRYVESLSSYARQFLGILHKPDVDSIDGLQPAISIDQKTRTSNPRSTVGTVTEIYDYMRLLFSKIGKPQCAECGIPIIKLSTQEIVDQIEKDIIIQINASKQPITLAILSPLVRDKKGSFDSLFKNLLSKGYTHIIVDGRNTPLTSDIHLIKTNKHTIQLIVDTISLSPKQIKNSEFMKILRSRIYSSVEQSVALSNSLVEVLFDTKKFTLYSQNYSCPTCGKSVPDLQPRFFSFNSPHGACHECRGLGYISSIDSDLLFNRDLTIAEGAILVFNKLLSHDTWFSRLFLTFLEEESIPKNIALNKLDNLQLTLLLEGSEQMYRVHGKNKYGKDTIVYEQFRGIVGELKRRHTETQSEYVRSEIEKYMKEITCQKCSGKRLNPDALTVFIQDMNIWDYGELSVGDLINTFNKINKEFTNFEHEVSNILLREIKSRLLFLKNVGLAYLTLNRYARTLSGGESQRIRLASQIGSGLSGVIYVLDEPSIGLHPKDVDALISSLHNLRNLGNTIIVVEHDSNTILKADHIIDFGPHAGKNGGEIVYEGSVANLQKIKTLTSQYLFNPKTHPYVLHQRNNTTSKTGFCTIRGCSQYNLKNIDASFPIGKLTCVTGVSGSGKSTLIVETLYKSLRYHIDGTSRDTIGSFKFIDGYEYFDSVYLVDQSPIGKTPRSNPATYIKAFDVIRDIYALTPDSRERGYKKGRFSFNVQGGRCEKCGGGGTIKIEMQFLPDVYIDCDVCQGKRYNSETLEVRYREKNIYDILSMTVEDARDFFASHPRVVSKLTTLIDVGLGYLELGQPAPTLSGGEAQRVKLAYELSKKSTGQTFYILDEPTTGLHMYDIEKLLIALYRLVDQGNTVVVIEHNIDVIKNCQYIIDLGPGGGDEGGNILYQGPVEGIRNISKSYTAKYL